MNFENLLLLLSNKNCETIYVKKLGINNNSKQQIYLTTNTRFLNIFPITEFKAVKHPLANDHTFHATCIFKWIDDLGNESLAPEAKFILYPQYPEIRFSGFATGCPSAPSDVLNHIVPGRLLFFGISKSNEIFGYAADVNSEVTQGFLKQKNLEKLGVLYSLTIKGKKVILDPKAELLKKLKQICSKGWINSKQLKPGFIEAPCNESRCGGLTLEAELGIIQNGKSEPDFLGWEVKQFGVKKMHLINSSRITLMTPEPDGGHYKEKGGISFVKKYGYPSKKSDSNRMDFTGCHIFGNIQQKSRLKFQITGFDEDDKKITDPNGGIYLLDKDDNIAASWSFAKMLTHWNKKHANAVYVPSLLNPTPIRQYRYSNKVLLGEGTDFIYFLRSFVNGFIFYDPGIHIDEIASRTVLKPRSQFRISSRYLKALYTKLDPIDLDETKS